MSCIPVKAIDIGYSEMESKCMQFIWISPLEADMSPDRLAILTQIKRRPY